MRGIEAAARQDAEARRRAEAEAARQQREPAAAAAIQRVYRGHVGRGTAFSLRRVALVVDAVAVLQSWWRARMARKLVAERRGKMRLKVDAMDQDAAIRRAVERGGGSPRIHQGFLRGMFDGIEEPSSPPSSSSSLPPPSSTDAALQDAPPGSPAGSSRSPSNRRMRKKRSSAARGGGIGGLSIVVDEPSSPPPASPRASKTGRTFMDEMMRGIEPLPPPLGGTGAPGGGGAAATATSSVTRRSSHQEDPPTREAINKLLLFAEVPHPKARTLAQRLTTFRPKSPSQDHVPWNEADLVQMCECPSAFIANLAEVGIELNQQQRERVVERFYIVQVGPGAVVAAKAAAGPIETESSTGDVMVAQEGEDAEVSVGGGAVRVRWSSKRASVHKLSVEELAPTSNASLEHDARAQFL